MQIAYPNEGVSPRVSMRGPKPEPKQNPRHRHRKSALNYHPLPPQHTAPRAPGRSQPLPKSTTTGAGVWDSSLDP
jgi:hypothetical protein